MNRSHIRAAIVRAALWGLIPIDLACWLTHQGGPRRG